MIEKRHTSLFSGIIIINSGSIIIIGSCEFSFGADIITITDRPGDGAADACKDPAKRIPDLEAAEKRDGETLATEEGAHMTDSVICHSPGMGGRAHTEK